MDLRLKDRYKQRLAKNSMPASSHKKENELQTIRGAVQYRIVPRGFLESEKLLEKPITTMLETIWNFMEHG